ncbi:MAG: cadherin repeat domain-containing protein [Planctomycetes bacterium]|nr:cadherin repeat domain-containing protein [Planctomycetota bacterium]
MQAREKILAAILAITVGGGVILPRGWKAYNEPLNQRMERIQKLDEKLETLRFDRQVARAKLRKMAAWTKQSLPASPQNAMVLYQQWLTDLAEEVAQFENVTVTPERLVRARDGSYVSVRVKLTAEGTIDRIRNFLFAFYNTNLLQHIVGLTVENRNRGVNGPMAVSITVEGLSLPGAPDRGSSLFPRTRLAADIDEQAETVTVESAADFPEKPPFRVRIGGEFMIVAKADRKRWTVQRRASGFPAAKHPAGSTVELAPVNPQMKAASLGDYNVLVTLNPFAKPQKEAPPETPNAPPMIEALEPIAILPGETATFKVSALDLETPDQLKFSLGSGAPSGATIDPKTGQFTWKTTWDTAPGDYRVTVQVTDGSPNPMTASQTVTITVKEDVAQYTYLVGAGRKDELREAWLYDRSNNRRLILHEGETLRYAGVEAAVVAIHRDHIVLRTNEAVWKLDLGQNLRSMQKVRDLVVAKPDVPSVSPPPDSAPPPSTSGPSSAPTSPTTGSPKRPSPEPGTPQRRAPESSGAERASDGASAVSPTSDASQKESNEPETESPAEQG